MKSIILTGMMGSGKTTCGKRLAGLLRRRFVDTDAAVVRRAGKPIPEIFEQDGEAVFRDWEARVCRELAGRRDLVVATGGGVILRPENVEALREAGAVVFLNRPADLIFESTSLRDRPLAQNGKAAFLKTFADREPAYRGSADVEILEFSSVDATVRRILEELQRLEDVL